MIKHNLNRPAGAACIVLVLIALVFSLTIATGSWAAPARVTVDSTSPEKINLSVGKSVIIEVKERVKRVSMDSKNVADYHMINPQKFIVTGKSLGITRITLWKDDQAVSRVIDIEVAPNVNELKMKIHELFPEEKNVKVTGAHDALTLSGTVSSSANAAQILTLAQAYASKGQAGKQGAQVINLLEVGGVHQVMLEVRVAEMQRSLLRKLGVNFAYLSDGGNTFGISRLDALTSAAVPGGGLPGVSGSINAIFRFLGGNASWTVFIDALKDEGLTKILAEPTLITLSGKKANFLAGGEFPVPVPQTGGVGTTITIEYKTFGVGLNFTPTVLSDRKISMEVAPEVSQLDFTNAVAFQGFVVPGVTTRRVATVIELADGQSFAIAGLLNDEVRESVRKFPVLGDLPIIGVLFRSTEFQKRETELIVIVTPHLVKPLDMAKQTLPTDQYIEPNDFEWYLMGQLEGRGDGGAPGASPQAAVPGRKSGLEGEFGHILPK